MKKKEKPKIKKIYTDVLIRLAPGPIGRGMKIKEIAKDLGIAESTVYYRLQVFRKKYPEAWKNFINLRNLARNDRYKLRWKRNSRQSCFILTGHNGDISDKRGNLISYADEKGLIRRVF